MGLPSGRVIVAQQMPCDPSALEGWPATLITMPGLSVSGVQPVLRQIQGRAQFDLPLDCFALVIGGVEIQKRVRVLEEEFRDGSLGLHLLRRVIERGTRMVGANRHRALQQPDREDCRQPPQANAERS